VTWEYDYRGRRIRQTTYDGSSGSYLVTEDLKLLSDLSAGLAGGWNLIAELDGSNNLVRAYQWGLDLSGSMDGAGGVGGLLWVNSAANGVHFAAFDGNGNVAGLVKGTDGTVTAWYEYGPFGEAIRVAGAMAKENPFRFSTKRANDTSDLVLYEYRAYSPATGRWISRDPLSAAWAFGPYAFVRNDGINSLDLLGLWEIRRDPTRNWAEAVAEDGDTVDALAALIRLDSQESDKWLKDASGGGVRRTAQPHPCGVYKIPNAVVIFTSRPRLGDGYPTFVTHLRRLAIRSGEAYLAKGHALRLALNRDSEDEFIGLWETDGLFAVAFAGHGTTFGFQAEPSTSKQVDPSQVIPPYKLQAIGAYSCYSRRPFP
jgi:RHS repeat-associated protein